MIVIIVTILPEDMIIITETILPGAIIIIVIFPGVTTVMVKYFLDTYIGK